MRERRTIAILASVISAFFLIAASSGGGVNTSAQPSKASVVEVVEKDIQYKPDVVELKVGQTLRIVNSDPFFHESQINKMTPEGNEGRVVLERARENAGEQRTFTFTRPGTYKLRCMVHDGMTALIHVT